MPSAPTVGGKPELFVDALDLRPVDLEPDDLARDVLDAAPRGAPAAR